MAKKKLPPEVLEFFKKQGAKGGKLSGQARMERMTPEQRSEVARQAAAASAAVRTAKAAAKKAASGSKPPKPKSR